MHYFISDSLCCVHKRRPDIGLSDAVGVADFGGRHPVRQITHDELYGDSRPSNHRLPAKDAGVDVDSFAPISGYSHRSLPVAELYDESA
jgi:hypothetical protein